MRQLQFALKYVFWLAGQSPQAPHEPGKFRN